MGPGAVYGADRRRRLVRRRGRPTGRLGGAPGQAAHERPAPAVDHRQAVAAQRELVGRRRVPLVPLELVGGEVLGLGPHHPVPDDLGRAPRPPRRRRSAGRRRSSARRPAAAPRRARAARRRRPPARARAAGGCGPSRSHRARRARPRRGRRRGPPAPGRWPGAAPRSSPTDRTPPRWRDRRPRPRTTRPPPRRSPRGAPRAAAWSRGATWAPTACARRDARPRPRR